MFKFPEPITLLPEADIPIEGCTANLSQTDTHQILFMQFEKDVNLPLHSHAAQWGVVFAGRIEMTIDGITRMYTAGENYFIPAGVEHHGRIFAGYADMTYFDQVDRYGIKDVGR